MSWVVFWKFLHIAFMFGAVALFVGGGVVSQRVQHGKDVRAIRGVLTTESRLAPVAGVMMLLGLVFGFVTAIAAGFDLLAPWLLITYGLILGIVLVGALYHGPHDRKLQGAVAESPESEPSPDLLGMIEGSRSDSVVNVIDAVLWVGVIFVMVTKPFGM